MSELVAPKKHTSKLTIKTPTGKSATRPLSIERRNRRKKGRIAAFIKQLK